jgi:hypothetical protein
VFLVGIASSKIYSHYLVNNLKDELIYKKLFAKMKFDKESSKGDKNLQSQDFKSKISDHEELKNSKSAKDSINALYNHNKEQNIVKDSSLDFPLKKYSEVHPKERSNTKKKTNNNRFSDKFLFWDIFKVIRFKSICTACCNKSKMANQIDEYK